MSNLIQNGDFSSAFDHWDNGVGGGSPYVLDSGKARGSSLGSDERYYKMSQPFSINDEPVSGKATVWCKWQSYDASGNGYNRFIVNLIKPDLTPVSLLDTTKTAKSGEGYLLNDYNILAHLDQYGNYTLQLFLKTKGTQNPSPPPELFFKSYGWYDNISLDVTVKKYKSVHEKMGGSGASSTHASHQYKSVAEASGLSERYNFKVCKTVAEAIGLSESYETDVKEAQFKAVAESMGLVEAYSIQKTLHRASAETVGLSETLQAKRTQGNLETTYTIDQLTQWSETSRVTTPWVKITKVIP